MSIVIATPTGHIGRRVVERLLAAGRAFSVVSRDPSRLSAAVRAAATVVTGSLDEPGVLERATVGASALFLLVPPNYASDDPAGFSLGIGRLAADAVRANGVSRVVMLSSAGAHRSDLRGVSRLGQIEKLLEAVAPNVTSLRPAFFFENLLSAVPTIAGHNTFYLPFGADQPITMVATRDIGDAAANALLDDSWSGHRVLGVHGPADHSMHDVAKLIGEQLGREVNYVQADFDGVQGALLGAGASAAVAEDLATLYMGLAVHAADHEPRAPETTGPTTVASFVETVLVPAIRS